MVSKNPENKVTRFIHLQLLAFAANVGYIKEKTTAIGGMSRAEPDAELTKGVESLKSGRIYTADEADAELAREFGI